MTTLEKIKAEILFKNRYQFSGYGIDVYLKIDDVLAVLDKYAEQEPCDDVVSRQAVINLIRGCNSALEEPRIFDCHNAGGKFEQYVMELPSVRPQEQTGHWILDEDKSLMFNVYKCSNCENIGARKSKYCSNCGAKMNIPYEPQERGGEE